MGSKGRRFGSGGYLCWALDFRLLEHGGKVIGKMVRSISCDPAAGNYIQRMVSQL